jgi:hypothetical protein
MTEEAEPREVPDWRALLDMPLADIPAWHVAEVVRSIVGVEPLEVSAFNSSI